MSNIDKDRIVCRCKKVSEGTIIEAIQNGADTYEKVSEAVDTLQKRWLLRFLPPGHRLAPLRL